MKLVCGVGNPGSTYEDTRHNVGFRVADLLAERHGATSFRSRFDARVAEAGLGAERFLLIKPQTYVNETGRALRQALDWYHSTPEETLVVVDDFNLPLGSLRARRGGSSGGHRGLESVAAHLGGPDYARLRLGIGSERRRNDNRDFVLSAFDVGEREALAELLERAADAVEMWLRHGIERCMSVCNARPRPPEETSESEKEENV